MNACSLLIGIVSQAYIAEGGYNICHLTYLYIYSIFFLVSRVLDMIIPVLLTWWNRYVLRFCWAKFSMAPVFGIRKKQLCVYYIYMYIEFWHFTWTIVSHFSISSAFLSIAQGCWDRFVVQIWFVCSSVLGVVGRSAVSLLAPEILDGLCDPQSTGKLSWFWTFELSKLLDVWLILINGGYRRIGLQANFPNRRIWM